MPLLASAMKIESDKIDEFTGHRHVTTSWETIWKDYTKGYGQVRFRSVNGVTCLDLRFHYNGAIVIGEGDLLMFKSTTGSILELHSMSTFSGDKGLGPGGIMGANAWGIKATYLGDMSWFSDNASILCRIYTTDGYFDHKIPENNGRKICKLYRLLTSHIDGNIDTTLQSYELTFCSRGIKSKEWDIDKEETIEYVDKNELQTIINEWKAQSNEHKVYDVKVKKLK